MKKPIITIAALALILLGSLAFTQYQFAPASTPDALATSDTSAVSSAPAVETAANGGDDPVLLVVGDSLSAGYGLASVADSWVSLLQQRLQREGYGIRVVNASISGDTTRGGAARLPAALERHEPVAVVIELGGNDGLRGFPLEEMRDNLENMITASQAKGADVLLLGIMIPPNYGQRYTDAFQAQFVELSQRYEVSLVPFFLEDVALRPDLMQSDGIHPNEAAQPLMLERVWPKLETVVAEALDK